MCSNWRPPWQRLPYLAEVTHKSMLNYWPSILPVLPTYPTSSVTSIESETCTANFSHHKKLIIFHQNVGEILDTYTYSKEMLDQSHTFCMAWSSFFLESVQNTGILPTFWCQIKKKCWTWSYKMYGLVQHFFWNQCEYLAFYQHFDSYIIQKKLRHYQSGETPTLLLFPGILPAFNG